MTFRQACTAFLESRRPFLHPRTYIDYQYCAKWLIEFFGSKRLPEITADHIRKYQRQRMERCGAAMINHETSVLQQMLKRVGRWEQVGLGFQPLARPKTGPGRAISDEEERRLLRAGASTPRWEAAYFFALLSLHTTTARVNNFDTHDAGIY
jgi:integrase-like protein